MHAWARERRLVLRAPACWRCAGFCLASRSRVSSDALIVQSGTGRAVALTSGFRSRSRVFAKLLSHPRGTRSRGAGGRGYLLAVEPGELSTDLLLGWGQAATARPDASRRLHDRDYRGFQDRCDEA